MKILVTGCAGFIGSNLTDRLLSDGYGVIGIDNFNNYYDPKKKERNLAIAKKNNRFRLYREDILTKEEMTKIFKKEKPQIVIHLAARAGVRPSIANPGLYADVNVQGTVNLLQCAVDFDVKKFIFCSSSSVYGNSPKIPFTENDVCENIISPYGASKRSAEFFVQSFSKNFNLKAVILRLFTVYGPRGRPDMAPAIFCDAILRSKTINQFGNGTTSRDYTYIDDIIKGISKVIDKNFNFEIINLGNSHPVSLADFIKTIESATGKSAKIKRLPMQAGDVTKTWASIERARQLLSWSPKVGIGEGITNYLKWLEFHRE